MIRTLLSTVLLIACGAPAIAQYPQQGGYTINGWNHAPNCACSTCQQLRAQEAARRQPAAQPAPVPQPKVEKKVETPPPAPKDPEGVPAPKDETSKPLVKADTDTAKLPKSTATKTDIIKSIQDNPNLDATTKAQILAGLKDDTASPAIVPVVSAALQPKRTDADIPIDLTPRASTPKTVTTPKSGTAPKFDLLGTFDKKTPAVKADTDDAPPNPFAPIVPAPKPKDPAPAPKDPPKTSAVPQANRKESFLLMPIGQNDTDSTYEIPTTEIGVTVGSRVDYSTSWDVAKAVPNGKLLQFWVKPITKRPEKLKSVAYNWMVLPREDYLTWPDTTRVVLSSGTKSGNYVVILTASYVFLEGENVVQRTAQAITMVQVGEVVANLPPDPGLTGTAKAAFDWTSTVLRTNEYTDAKVKADSKKLSEVFLRVADRVKKGELTDVNAIITATKAENDTAIENRNEWLPWFTRMSDTLRRGYADNSIKTVEQYEATWREIARGLAAAGN